MTKPNGVREGRRKSAAPLNFTLGISSDHLYTSYTTCALKNFAAS